MRSSEEHVYARECHLYSAMNINSVKIIGNDKIMENIVCLIRLTCIVERKVLV